MNGEAENTGGLPRVRQGWAGKREAMELKKIDAHLWMRLYLDQFVIMPALHGAAHQFEFENKNVVIAIPKAAPAKSPVSEWDPIICNSWRKDEKGELIPLQFVVQCVEISVHIDKKVSVPSEILTLSPNQFDKVTVDKQKELTSTIHAHMGVGHRAFDHWLGVLRWKSRIGHIGEPRIAYAGAQGALAALRQTADNHRFWVPGGVITLPRQVPVSEDHWRRAQKALIGQVPPPVWLKFLFESEQRANNNDITAAFLNLAIALEVGIRALIAHTLRDKDIEPIVEKILDLSNIAAIANRLKMLTFWDKKWQKVADLSAFQTIMNRRNDIMHAARGIELDKKELDKFLKTVSKFVFFVDEYINPEF